MILPLIWHRLEFTVLSIVFLDKIAALCIIMKWYDLLIFLAIFEVVLVTQWPRLRTTLVPRAVPDISREILARREELGLPQGITEDHVMIQTIVFAQFDAASLLAYDLLFQKRFTAALNRFLALHNLHGILFTASCVIVTAEKELAARKRAGEKLTRETLDALLATAREIHERLGFADRDALRLATIYRQYGFDAKALYIEDKHCGAKKIDKTVLEKWAPYIDPAHACLVPQVSLSAETWHETVRNCAVSFLKLYPELYGSAA